MVNVLFLINHAGKAGTERYVRTLAEGAANYGMRPFLAYNEPGLLLDQLREYGVTCKRLPMRGPFDLAAARDLAIMCEDLKISVIHTNYLRENYVAILSKILYNRHIRIIYTNHYVTPAGLPVRMANRLMTRADHRIISVCEAGVENLIKNGNARKKIVVIHNAVDPLAWKPGADYPDIRAETRKKYGIADKDTVFFCASRFAHDKGHKFFIESLSRLADLYGVDHMRVLLAGDGPLEADAVARVEACGLSGTVIFTGFAVDIKPLFYAADVYVNPSEHEALSFLILEALASGLPVIATDMGGNGEIVNERNKCGALIEYGDVTALCRAIQAFRTNNAYLLDRKANALATIQNKFALSEMLAKSFASFY